jgi:RNA polymerase sigma-70 factor (ECF subfamily)
MLARPPDTNELIERARQGDDSARQRLLQRHHDRLRRMIVLRLDRRMAARVSPSDVIQDVLVEANEKLSDYLEHRPLPFYP